MTDAQFKTLLKALERLAVAVAELAVKQANPVVVYHHDVPALQPWPIVPAFPSYTVTAVSNTWAG